MDYKDILEELNLILEEYRKIEKKFNLEDKFRKDSKKVEKDLDVKKLKEIFQKLKDGKASLEEVEEVLKDYKKDDKKDSKKEDKETTEKKK